MKLYKGSYLSKEELEKLDKALKECELRNPVNRAKHWKSTTKPLLVGVKDKPLKVSLIKKPLSSWIWLEMKKMYVARTHKRWGNWKLTIKGNGYNYLNKNEI